MGVSIVVLFIAHVCFHFNLSLPHFSDELQIAPGDYVMLNSDNPNEAPLVARVCYMYEMAPLGPMFHAQLFCRGTDTILGVCADPRELFVVDSCDDLPLGSIVRKADVSYCPCINKLSRSL